MGKTTTLLIVFIVGISVCLGCGSDPFQPGLSQDGTTSGSGRVGNGRDPSIEPEPGGRFPDEIFLRTTTQTYNSYYFALVDRGDIWIKSIVDATNRPMTWTRLALPEGLEGDARELSMDDKTLIALNSARQIFTCQNMREDVSTFHWTERWGSPLWLGPPQYLPDDYLAWDLSVITPEEDMFYFDPAKNIKRVGLGQVHTIFVLDRNGTSITLIDPWLPNDYSYEVCGPREGRFIMRNLGASGSTMFVINEYGDMFTRLWDFDMSGGDTIFFAYTYADQGVKFIPWSAYIQLPPWPWVMQPKILGTITDNISIHKVGIGCVHRILRVEGVNEAGETGYYQKDIIEPFSEDWMFFVTNEPLTGTLLENEPYDSSGETIDTGKPLGITFEMKETVPCLMTARPGEGDACSLEILDFNIYRSPGVLRVRIPDGLFYDLVLHVVDPVRMFPRKNIDGNHGKGLDRQPRKMKATIEIPLELYNRKDTLPRAMQDFLGSYLNNFIYPVDRFTKAKIHVTTQSLHMKETYRIDWNFSRSDGTSWGAK